MSERDARDAMVRNDKARTTYVRHFYGADPADPRHYDLVVDSTRVPLKACTELIVAAAESCSA
jgi:cytidylate kinase